MLQLQVLCGIHLPLLLLLGLCWATSAAYQALREVIVLFAMVWMLSSPQRPMC